MGDRQESGQKRAGKRGGSDRILTHHPTTQEEDKEFNHPSYLKVQSILGFACMPYRSTFRKDGQSIGSPTLPNQLRHDNKPVGMVPLFFSFPWCWCPSILSSTDTFLALAILAVL